MYVCLCVRAHVCVLMCVLTLPSSLQDYGSNSFLQEILVNSNKEPFVLHVNFYFYFVVMCATLLNKTDIHPFCSHY